MTASPRSSAANECGRSPTPVLYAGRSESARTSQQWRSFTAGGWFEPLRTERWRWSVELDTNKVRRLFRTFPEWTDAEVESVSRAADDLGGVVTEHYQTVLHLLRKAADR